MRIISFFTTAAFLLSAIRAGAQSEFIADGVKYRAEDYDNATIIGYDDSMGELLVIPYTVQYSDAGSHYMLFVTKIEDGAFTDGHIKELYFAAPPYDIPDDYRKLTIGDQAFASDDITLIGVARPDLPIVEGNPFSEYAYEHAQLLISDELTPAQQNAYRTTDPWKRFFEEGGGIITGISQAENTPELSVNAVENGIEVICRNNSDGIISVYRINGTLIYSGGPGTIVTGHGLFIVRAGSSVVKISV